MPHNEPHTPDSPTGSLLRLPLRAPIADGPLYGEVLARVCVRLVMLDRKRNPERYKCKFEGIHALADEMRRDTFNPFTGFFYLVSLSKYVMAGGTMASWILWAGNQEPGTMRSIHKRPFKVRR